MRRAARTVLKWILSAASVWVAALWLLSGWCGVGYETLSGYGCSAVVGVLHVFRDPTAPCGGIRWMLPVKARPVWEFGFGFTTFPGTPMGWEADIPLWSVFLLTATPAVMLWRMDRNRRAGLCRSCGYDRRGLAADAKCPECGAVPTSGSVRCGSWVGG